ANGFGSFTLSAGSWTYTLDNASAAVQSLNAGQVVSDSHTFTASDGTQQAVTVSITGTNDVPVVAGVFTGAVAEDGQLTATGALSISDADANNAGVHFADVASTAGANGFGSFTLAAGSWTYTLDNASAAVQSLNAGQVVSDSHTFTASDGTQQAVTVSISDTDANNAGVHFADVAATAGANGFGSFTLSAGSWTYTLDNASAAVQSLNAGQVVS